MKKLSLIFPILALCACDNGADTTRLKCAFGADNSFDVIVTTQDKDNAVLTMNGKEFTLSTKAPDGYSEFYPNADVSYSTQDAKIGIAITKSARKEYRYIIKLPGEFLNPPSEYVFYPKCEEI